ASGFSGAGTVDVGAAEMVARERGRPPESVFARWRQGAAVLRETLADGDPHQCVDWVAGQLSMRTLATTRLAECWIHTGDVAGAIGIGQPPTDRLEHIARLAWRTLPYAFGRTGRQLAGPVAFELKAPSGKRWDFVPETAPPLTVIEGAGAELCLVAARRVDPASTALRGRGPDAAAVLELVRTYA
ncbi:MAG: maleylpyruvate isomerase family mycothiol-dependent enzyme, partial [Ilumatobacteraceae bacterium]